MNHLISEIYETAKEKGWWPSEQHKDVPMKSFDAIRMLIVSEIAEATEEVRSKKPAIYQVHDRGLDGPMAFTPDSKHWTPSLKPEGEAVELADAVIRILDYFGHKGWQVEEWIPGGLSISDDPLEHHMHFVKLISRAEFGAAHDCLSGAVRLIEKYFQKNGWDLEKVMRLKMDYNKTRSFRHGNKAY